MVKAGRLPGMFFVYENWTNTFAKVHNGSCPYCNEGQGFQGRGTNTPSGRWHGPISTAQAAMDKAASLAAVYSNRAVWVVEGCKHCAPS